MNDNNESDPFAPPQAQPAFIPLDGAPPPPPPPPPAMPPVQPGMGSVPPPPSPYGNGAPAPAGSSQKNYLGILALIFPFVSLSLVGIIMGHLGLSAVKKGTANNHGVALAGTIVSWVFTILIVPGILAAIAIPIYLDQQVKAEESAAASQFELPTDSAEPVTPGDPATPSVEAARGGPAIPGEVVPFSVLAVGDCIADPYDNVIEEPDGSSWLEGVVIVDCAQMHYGEVYAEPNVEADTYVEEDIYAQSDELCYYAFEDYMGVSYADSIYYYDPFYPMEGSWSAGDREVTCVVTSSASDTVGTLQGSGR